MWMVNYYKQDIEIFIKLFTAIKAGKDTKFFWVNQCMAVSLEILAFYTSSKV